MVSTAPTLLTRQEAAQRLAVDLRTLDRLVESGELASVAVSPRRVAIEQSEIAGYIARNRRTKPRELLTPAEASALLGLPSCVEPIGDRDVWLGEAANFPRPVKLGGLVRYRRSEVEAWVAANPDAAIPRIRHAGCGPDWFLCELRNRQWLRNETSGEILSVADMGSLRAAARQQDSNTLKAQVNLTDL